MKKMYSLGALGLAACFSFSASAQLTIHPHQTATTLAADLIDSAVVISSPVLICDTNAQAVFTDWSGSSALGMSSGIILTTGRASSDSSLSVFGVNGSASNFASTSLVLPGDTLLTAIAGINTYDACILEFDVTPTWDTLEFRYLFGSEEYTSYTCSFFNDVFGFFLTGPGYSSPTNIAIVPGTDNIPVAINSINCGPTGGGSLSTCNAMGPGAPFCDYYVNNASGSYITYDGYTTVLTAKATVVAGETYHLRLGVADASDDVLDSGVLLEGGSLYSKHGVSTTAVAATVSDKLVVMPNPFKSNFKVQVPSALNGQTLLCTITDISGNVAFTYNNLGSGLPQAIETASGYLHTGTYVITIDAPQTKYKQIMKVQKVD